MKSIILLCILVLTTAYAETWNVRGGETAFVLKISDDLLDYASEDLRAAIPLRDCNRQQAHGFMNSLRGHLRAPASVARDGIALQIDNQATTMVDANSHLGIQFGHMDESIRRLKLMNEFACD